MALLHRKAFGSQNKKPSGPGQLSTSSNDGQGNPDPWAGLFNQGMFGDNLQKSFLEPGKDIYTMAYRSVFAVTDLPDMREVIACYERYERFHQERDMNNLKLLLAASAGIGGLAREEALQAGAKILAESFLQHTADIRTGGIYQKNHNKNNQKENKMHYPAEEEDANGNR